MLRDQRNAILQANFSAYLSPFRDIARGEKTQTMNSYGAHALESMQSKGYYIWRSFQDAAFCKELQAQANIILTSKLAKFRFNSTRVFELYRHGDIFVKLMCDSRLLELIEILLGKYPFLSDFSLNRVGSNEPPDKWHIDYPYTYMSNIVRGSLLGLQCIMPLSPFTAETGATQFVPGSYTQFSKPTFDPPADSVVTFTAEPGDLLILAASTWHRAGVNTTRDPRTAVVSSFVESWVIPMITPVGDGPWATAPLVRQLLGLDRYAPVDFVNALRD
ncbi:phytanoyl-CoA dioxygenase family protein [Nonomuraea sp. NPDC004297]